MAERPRNPPPWQQAPPAASTPSGCAGCVRPRRSARKVVINAFHDRPSAEVEDGRRPNNRIGGDGLPADLRAVVLLVEKYAAEQPIDELEIACHGTGGDISDLATEGFYGVGEHERDNPAAHGRPGFYRRESDLDIPGAMIVGTLAEVVSANTLRSHHREFAQRIGRAVEPGGRIVLQACFIALPNSPAATATMLDLSRAQEAMGRSDRAQALAAVESSLARRPEALASDQGYGIWGGFLVDELSLAAPHVTVSGAAGATLAGVPGLQGPLLQRRVAANGSAMNVPETSAGTRVDEPAHPVASYPPATSPRSPFRPPPQAAPRRR